MSGSTPVVSLGGWDLAVSLPFAVVNQALAAAPQSSFSYSGAAYGQGYTLSGKLGAWSITGGAGQNVTIALPVTAGSIAVSGTGLLPIGSHDLGGATVTITARLAFSTPAQDGSVQLAFDVTPQTPIAAGSPAASATGGVSGTAQLDPMVAAVLPSALASCVAANANLLPFALAGLTPNFNGPPPAGTQLAYLVDTPSGGSARLVVLCAYSTASPPTPQVPQAFDGVGDVAVALSQALVLSDVLLPALASGLEAAQYPMSGMNLGGLPGPQIHTHGVRPNSVDPATFTATATGMANAMVAAPGPIPLNILSMNDTTPTVTLTVTALSMAVSGSTAQLSLAGANSSLFPPMTFSLPLAASIVSAGLSQHAALSLASTQPATVSVGSGGSVPGILQTLGAVMATRITNGFAGLSLPIAVQICGATPTPTGGWLSGGLVFTGTLPTPLNTRTGSR